MLDTPGFCDLITQTSQGGLKESLDAFIVALKGWCGSRPFDDDVSIFVLEVPPF